MWWHQVHRALLKFDAITLAAIHDVQERVALKLPEIFLKRIVVKVGALVRAADDGDDEIGVFPQLLVADGWFEQVRVVYEPLREIDGAVHFGFAVG